MSSIVICCDGTWNSADQEAVNGEICVTNVLKIACRLKKETTKGELQIVYYDQGVAQATRSTASSEGRLATAWRQTSTTPTASSSPPQPWA